ncbi:helicase-related protein [Candidatus Spongiihabitans sp.]|uniref:helicase-related protein n=1 Tax=Candidatus Spongiihabitans sp. TaxID=3101308 RepID=UPI003C7C2E84
MNISKKQIILDNRSPQTSVGEYLRGQLAGGAKVLRIVSAYFTVYAYEMLRDRLENVGAVQFLYGDPGSVGEVDPGEKQGKGFDLTERGLLPKQLLQQKRLARDCEKWVEESRVKVRTIKQANFLHGKMYHIERQGALDTAVVGSSNFTRRGLGFNQGANLELNLAVSETDTCDQLKHWFDDVWRDENLTRDARKDVLAALRRLGENCSPEFVYFKTLLEVFRDRLGAREETGDRLGDAHLKDTRIWQALYQFQRDGVAGIINRLRQHNGCILADSVGLGKTYTALAVIRYYQAQNQRVLVLCPKKLNENWKLYPTQFGQKGNPFKDDNFHYEVLHHSDLSRVSGESNGINLAEFDWASYGLVVIDESHNFRNESRSARDESGEIIRRSRYERLLEDVIKAGGKTSVLMLSATPVNTSLTDLRNQIYFMTGKHEAAFQETLGIGHLSAMLSAAQKQFKHWEQQIGEKHKRDLFDQLGGEFFTLLDAVSIARSRRHIKKFYPEVVKEIGGFPEQAMPQNETPPTDLQGELSFEALNEEIKNFGLSIYTPAAYVISEQAKQELAEEKKRFNFNQADREKWLIGMIRVNFLKRLESAAPSLALTLQRTMGKIDQLVTRIERYQSAHAIDEEVPENDWEDELEDEDFIVNKARHPFAFKDLDLSQWLDDLKKDHRVLNNVLAKVAAITPQRDGKLAALNKQIRDKLKNPTTDKDGRENRKVLIFTTFKDTALYLHKELSPLMEEFGANYAMVVGDTTKTTYGNNKFNDILTNFAPIGRSRFKRDENGVPIVDGESEIDILIATDCVSEGQNLQDCDLVVNYDIHWNPVRLIQRFGRIDRIGSRNKEVKMINFWPMEELDRYINLQSRVEARMALVDASATGDDRLVPDNEIRDNAQMEQNFRDAQLRRLRDEVLDLDDLDDGVTLSDFSLDDFLAQLMNYLEQNREQLENAPLGVYAIADCAWQQESLIRNATPGVIFCLRHKNPPKDARVRSPLKAYYLVYVRDDGEVRYNYTHAKQVLELFGELARGKNEPLLPRCDAFDRETDNGQNMGKYDQLLDSVFLAISKQFDRQEAGSLNNRDGILSRQSEQPRNANDFELVTWLVIKGSS